MRYREEKKLKDDVKMWKFSFTLGCLQHVLLRVCDEVKESRGAKQLQRDRPCDLKSIPSLTQQVTSVTVDEG